MSDGRCIAVCRDCGDGYGAMPFTSYADRGRWCGAHTRGSGHDRWYVTDGRPDPVGLADEIRRHDQLKAALIGRHLRRVDEQSEDGQRCTLSRNTP